MAITAEMVVDSLTGKTIEEMQSIADAYTVLGHKVTLTVKHILIPPKETKILFTDRTGLLVASFHPSGKLSGFYARRDLLIR